MLIKKYLNMYKTKTMHPEVWSKFFPSPAGSTFTCYALSQNLIIKDRQEARTCKASLDDI